MYNRNWAVICKGDGNVRDIIQEALRLLQRPSYLPLLKAEGCRSALPYRYAARGCDISGSGRGRHEVWSSRPAPPEHQASNAGMAGMAGCCMIQGSLPRISSCSVLQYPSAFLNYFECVGANYNFCRAKRPGNGLLDHNPGALSEYVFVCNGAFEHCPYFGHSRCVSFPGLLFLVHAP